MRRAIVSGLISVERLIPRAIRERKNRYLQIISIASLITTFVVSAYTHRSPVIGVGVPLMWLFHESGHVFACMYHRIPVRWVLFLPFVGALMRTKEEFKSSEIEATVAIMGPIAGLVATGVGLIAWDLWGAQFSISVTRDLLNVLVIAAIYNLIQLLITTPPFDGGRVMSIVHPWFRVFGWVVLVGLLFFIERTWVVTLLILALTYWRFAIAWRRLLVIILLALLMILGIFLGYGNKVWWWNIGDAIVVGLALYWTYGEVRRDNKPFHLLAEWRAFVRSIKHVRGSWVTRGDDRRNDTRDGHERRVYHGVRVPTTMLPGRPLPQGIVDRRGKERNDRRWLWFLAWFSVTVFAALLIRWILLRG